MASICFEIGAFATISATVEGSTATLNIFSAPSVIKTAQHRHELL
jgi:hypothetical protein